MTINATRIETMLAERGLTKAALAANCGISRQNVSTIIRRGTCEPKTVGKLAAGLGVPVADIIKEV
ncbi:MAG: helix-turn-helix transcriptional regulator [Oscillospiraceae bacterium]|nr:helix-turn-helix transcriptional regulator [Oscillospiraceae bacterium]